MAAGFGLYFSSFGAVLVSAMLASQSQQLPYMAHCVHKQYGCAE